MPPVQLIYLFKDIILQFLINFVNYSWLWLLLFLYIIFEQLWLFSIQASYKNFESVLLEIKIPRQIEKTPKAMEQVFLNLYGLRNSADDFLEKYVDGEVTIWWSLELASYGGEIHFYIRTPKKHKKMTEAALYAQYPDLEIVEVSDYINGLPATTSELYQKNYQMFGSEIVLRKEDFLPIRTYEEFKTPPAEAEAMDPISALIEVLSKIDRKENVYFQILIRPAGSSWTKEADPMLKKLKAGTKQDETIKNAKGETITMSRNLPPSPRERDILEAIERSISKPGFYTLIRFLYIAPKSIYNVNFARRGIIGALNQYSSQDLNSFRGNSKIETRSRWIYFPHLFVKKRVEAKKQRILENYRKRKLPEELWMGKLMLAHPFNFNFASKTFILNIEELATIFHPPMKAVLTGPHIKLNESKKMAPPAGLPIFTEE